jgi:hypothetical protein
MLRLMRRAILAGLAALLVTAPAALAQQAPAGPWDGQNPFACTLQQLGTGTDYPDPDADPFCVEFDKTHQSVAEGGMIDFLSKEPARVAAASPKCFYFQHDHWTATISDGQPPELYHWDGSYFFDKARGVGGVYVENFRIAGQTGDPTQLPGFPEEWKPYFSAGRGGIQATDGVEADPSCATKPNPTGPGGGTPANGDGKCRVAGGRIRRHIDGLRLFTKRARAKRDLGAPATESEAYATWCYEGGGRMVAMFGRPGERGRAQFLMTEAQPFYTVRVKIGMTTKRARKRIRGERRLVRGAWCRREKRRHLCFGASAGRITWLGIGRRKLTRRETRAYVRAVPPA